MDLLLRSSDLFFKYPNSKREKLRDDFYFELESYFNNSYGTEFCRELHVIISVLKRTEIGYRRILALLKELPARTRPPETQCSAAMELAIRRLRFVDSRTWGAISKLKDNLVISSDIEGVLDDGTRFSVDSVTVGYVGNLATTLLMFAIENNWIAEDGAVVLPAPIECTEEEIEESSGTELLAMSWRRWERVEQRRRYWGGSFLEIEGGKYHAHLPPDARVYFEYVPNHEDQFDWVANERLKDSVFQAVTGLRFESFAHERLSSVTKQAKLPPDEFISLSEIYSGAFLSAVLGVDVREDPTVYSGLRVVEWLRGYCALSEIAGLKAGHDNLTKEFVVKFAPGELENQLTRVGLSYEAAKSFISSATFNSRSFDLFDCPLLNYHDGSVRLFVPAAIYADASAVAYSNLISLGHSFDKKGKRFEKAVSEFFRKNGFNPYSINASRGGSSYEIDVILPWEQYLFVFECKNKGLSDNHPVRSFYFRKERDGFVRQIRRQIEGLLRYPDISVEAGGVNPNERIIVPCVLYELPYSEAGQCDGVYFTDWYSLSRFFSDRYLSFKKPYDLFGKHQLLHRTAIYSFWRGERPKPSDLLRQLEEPIQVRIVLSSLTETDSLFALGENAFGLTKEYYRKNQTLHELARILDFDAQEAKDDDRRVEKSVRRLNRNFERKRLLAQTRAFREKKKRDRE